jgi:hypothetical protein
VAVYSVADLYYQERRAELIAKSKAWYGTEERKMEEQPVGQFVTKDSGQRQEFSSGMRRDTEEGKTLWHLLLPKAMRVADSLLGRWAALLTRGAKKYTARNWEMAAGEEELERYRSSAFRHFMQWWDGDTDEDHAAAVVFNLQGAEYVKWRLALDAAAKGVNVDVKAGGQS